MRAVERHRPQERRVMKHKKPSTSFQKQLNKRFPYSSAKEERGAMSYRNDRFNKTFLSLDELAESIDPGKSLVYSDKGKGARQIRRAADHEDELEAARDIEMENQRFVLLMVAAGMLALCDEERLVQVLEQIAENGADRQKSICRLSRRWQAKLETARRKYYRGATALLMLFSPNKIKGETHVEKHECHTAAPEI